MRMVRGDDDQGTGWGVSELRVREMRDWMEKYEPKVDPRWVEMECACGDRYEGSHPGIWFSDHVWRCLEVRIDPIYYLGPGR